MFKVVTLLFLSTLLIAQNPKIYSALGDEIYDNLFSIINLQKIDYYKKDSQKIYKYEMSVLNTKQNGFDIQNNKYTITKAQYLEELRGLSKINTSYIRSSEILFNKAIEEGNSEQFNSLIATGIIDINKYRNEIFNYYLSHKDSIYVTVEIQNVIDEQTKTKKQKAKIKSHNSQRYIDYRRIQSIREADRRKKERYEQLLQKELEEKKLEIRSQQLKI